MRPVFSSTGLVGALCKADGYTIPYQLLDQLVFYISVMTHQFLHRLGR
jgi:hypothetical protein